MHTNDEHKDDDDDYVQLVSLTFKIFTLFTQDFFYIEQSADTNVSL